MSDGDTSVNNDATTGENDDSKVEADSSVAISDREAYFQALRMWIQQAQMYQNISTCFPYYMMTFQGFQNNPTNAPLLNNNYQFQGPQFPFQMPNFRPVIENRPPAENLTPAEGTLIYQFIVDIEILMYFVEFY